MKPIVPALIAMTAGLATTFAAAHMAGQASEARLRALVHERAEMHVQGFEDALEQHMLMARALSALADRHGAPDTAALHRFAATLDVAERLPGSAVVWLNPDGTGRHKVQACAPAPACGRLHGLVVQVPDGSGTILSAGPDSVLPEPGATALLVDRRPDAKGGTAALVLPASMLAGDIGQHGTFLQFDVILRSRDGETEIARWSHDGTPDAALPAVFETVVPRANPLWRVSLHPRGEMRGIYASHEYGSHEPLRIGLFGGAISLLLAAYVWMLARQRATVVTQVAERTRGLDAANRALLESEERYRVLVENMHDGLFLIHNGRIAFANTAMAEMVGRSVEGITGASIADLVAPEDLPMVMDRYRRRLSGEAVPERYEFNLVHTDGHRVTVLMSVAVMSRADGEKVSIGTLKDITERKRIEVDLQRNLAFMHAINALQTLAMSDRGLDDILQQALETLTTVPFLSVDGQGCVFLVAGEEGHRYLEMRAHTGLPATVLTACARVPFGFCECGRAATAAAPVFVDAHAHGDAGASGTHGHYCVPIRERDSLKGVLNIYVAATHRWDAEEERFLESAAKTLAGVIARKEAEERLDETLSEMRRSNAELEQFAYVASHDLQEPLRMVTSYVQLLQRRHGSRLDGEAAEFMEFAIDGARRMQSLISDLLDYSRVGRGRRDFVRVDTDKVLAEAIATLRGAAQECGATIVADPLPAVRGDATEVFHLFLNLVSNALKYRHDERPLLVRIRGRREGRTCTFEVIDNGIGIEPQYRERVFLIFQRLHGRGQYTGTGIGLALCKKIVERHGGTIGVEDGPEGGTTFVFTLPAEPETVALDAQPPDTLDQP